MATDQNTLPSSWRQDPRAVALLNECAINHPSTRVFRYAHWHAEERYIGTAPRDLKRIYNLHGQQPLADGDRTGDYTAFSAWAADSVTQAITDAICAAQERIAA